MKLGINFTRNGPITKIIKKNEYEYKTFRNSLNKKLNYAKNQYYKSKFLENRNNSRVTWQIINEIIGKTSNNIDETLKT